MESETRGRNHDTNALLHSSRPPIRLAVGLGDPERERELLQALDESGDFVVSERCLAADQLLSQLDSGQTDAAVVDFGLHRLNTSIMGDLVRTRVPVLFLGKPPDERCSLISGTFLPYDSDSESIRQALQSMARGEQPHVAARQGEREAQHAEQQKMQSVRSVGITTIAVASGHGSPGCTTVALNLATVLGAVAPTILVDADLSGPSIAAHLDADPTRNLYMLAHAEPKTPREWERTIDQETQPLGNRSPYGFVLCGVPKPEMRSGVSVPFFEQLLAELQQRFRYVVLDVGADLLGSEATLHRAALRLARQILLVAGADLVSLWHVRSVLRQLNGSLQVSRDRVTLVVNRHDRRYHHGRREIEWALGVPLAAVIPYDYGAAQRSLAAQRPLVLDGRSRAGRVFVDLAHRINGGSITLPPEPNANGRTSRLLPWLAALDLRQQRFGGAKGREKGDLRGNRIFPTR